MSKLKMHSPDLTAANIDKLAQLFPNCVTESRDEKGELRKSVDFDLLRQELSGAVVEGLVERYTLNWPGKSEAIVAANSPVYKTLRPCEAESVDFATTKNLYIEGDNLEVLKLLQETYLGKVKMIYIDPPYNTGNDFIYDDDFAENVEADLIKSSQKNEAGGRLVANPQSNGRFHSDWLTMMYPRLKLARDLLRDDGVMFISIDDNETHNMRKMCDEIIGATNFIAGLAVQLNPRGRHLDKFVARTHETILVYAKNANAKDVMVGIEKTGDMLAEYNLEDENGKYRLLGLRNRNQSFNPETRPNLYFPLHVNPKTASISLTEDSKHTDIVWPVASNGTPTCWTWGKPKIQADAALLVAEKVSDEWRIYRKDYLVDASGATATTLVKSLWIDGEITNDNGRTAIKDLFGKSLMDFPKSPDLVAKCLRTVPLVDETIIMDFFSGSATTAHAVWKLNAEDDEDRRFIMVQLPEVCDEKSEAFKAGYKTICEIGKERIRRAGQQIKEENATNAPNFDVGFRVFKLDSSNMKDVYYTPDTLDQKKLDLFADAIKEDRTADDLLFQVFLDCGLDLALPVTKEMIDGKPVFTVDQNVLIACFDNDIPESLIRTLAKRKPLKAVFLDRSFVKDSTKLNVTQIFKQLSSGTEVKTI
jgi:adenine-specific DNA-methyltransferase